MKKWYFSLPYDVEEPDSVESLYRHRFGFNPRPFQEVIYHSVQDLNDPGIVIVEAPTGCGKTEAALAAAEQLASKSGRSGLFFGLPTQATSDGIFERVLRWTQNVAEDYGNTSIRLQHGKAALNPVFADLRYSQNASEVDVEDTGNGTVQVNEWFSGRKTASLDDFVVGTVDQFLLMALKQKHFALRHLGFSRKVIIIDEVHAYDAYMQQYLMEALRWAGAYKTPVILLSATLSANTRSSLLGAYMMGLGVKTRDWKDQKDHLIQAYPLLTASDGNHVAQFTDFPVEGTRIVEVNSIQEEDCLNLVERLTEEGGIVGIIVNTVKRAQMLARECIRRFGTDTVELLHASFLAADRSRKQQRILAMVGKGAERPYKKIIIGTQVLEQSLDIDFDVLITDLCPMDLLIQRIGRLQRHSVSRPAAHSRPVVYVMGESDSWNFEGGSAHVYGEYLLARTQELLPAKIHFPEDVPVLVQKVYDSDAWEDLHADEDLQSTYMQFKEKFLDDAEDEKNKAKTYRLQDPKKIINPEKNNLIGILGTSSETASEEMACAQVRDTQESVEVIALKAEGDGYGVFGGHEDLSGRIEEPQVAQMIARQTLRLPQSITSYGRAGEVIRELEDYNRRYLAVWQQQQWLKGSLGIIFDSDNRFMLGGTTLIYDSVLGLRVYREGENEQI